MDPYYPQWKLAERLARIIRSRQTVRPEVVSEVRERLLHRVPA
jgi:hypothetical protein